MIRRVNAKTPRHPEMTGRCVLRAGLVTDYGRFIRDAASGFPPNPSSAH